jgi:serine/threonine-protein kinase
MSNVGESGSILVDSLFADRYQLARVLGGGGMAEVYLARDRKLDRDIALKVLPHRYACDPESVERFRREAGAAARLNHPHIVQIYDWGEAAGTYYISMEYVSGRSLKEVIREEGSLPFEKIVSVATQVLDALAFVHAAGFVHRDIKPQNILLDDRGRAKVADLGIVRAADSGGMTAKGSILGTAQYLSPEQAQGQTATPASDLYSLGAVMYEMATGRPPFAGENPVALALQHVGEPPEPPSRLRPGLPAALEEVILRALAKAPGERWTSAQEFADALAATNFGDAPDGSDEAAPDPAKTMMMRPVSAESAAEKTEIRPGRGPAAAPEKPADGLRLGRFKRRALVWLLLTLLCLVLAGGGVYGVVFLFKAEAVAVPSLVGHTLAEAEEQAQISGLKVEAGGPSENSSEYEEGKIVRQQPQEGAESTEGQTVYVWLSAGPEMVLVPDLDGMIEQEAIDAVRSSELEVTVIRQETADEAPGEVYAQDPRAGDEVEVGSTVEISVAIAPPTTTTSSTTTTTVPPTTDDPGTGWWPWEWDWPW